MSNRQNFSSKAGTSAFVQMAHHPFFHIGMVALFAVIYFLVRRQFFAIPMERDEGIYSYFGQLILDGKVPYRDFYEHRLPGNFYMYALLVGLFGPFKGLACGITLLNIGSMLFIFHIARNWFDKTAGLIAVVTFGILTLAPEISGYTRQSEHLVVFWAMGGLYFVQKGLRSGKRHNFFLAGLFMCLSMLIKPNGVFFIIMGGLWSIGYDLLKKEEPQRVRKSLINGTIFSLGVFGTFAVLCVFMLFHGVLDDMWYWAVTYARGYVSEISFEQGKQFFLGVFIPFYRNYWPVWILAGVGLVTYTILQNEQDALFKKSALFVTALLSFMTIVPGFRFFGHYWIMLVPGLAFAVAAAVYALPRLVPARAEKVRTDLVAGFCLLVVIHFVLLRHYYLSPDYTAVLRSTYSDAPFSEVKVVGDYVRRIMRPRDQIALWGASEPELYIYTGCRSATRHAWFSFLMDDPKTTDALKWQKEYINEIETNRPRFVIAFLCGNAFWDYQPCASTEVIKWFFQYIPKHYHVAGVVESIGTSRLRYIWDEDILESYTYRPMQEGLQILILERNQDSPERTGNATSGSMP